MLLYKWRNYFPENCNPQHNLLLFKNCFVLYCSCLNSEFLYSKTSLIKKYNDSRLDSWCWIKTGENIITIHNTVILVLSVIKCLDKEFSLNREDSSLFRFNFIAQWLLYSTFIMKFTMKWVRNYTIVS